MIRRRMNRASGQGTSSAPRSEQRWPRGRAIAAACRWIEAFEPRVLLSGPEDELLIPETFLPEWGMESPPADPPPDAPQTIGIGFDAISAEDQATDFGINNVWIPPDTMGAIGPNHFVEMINGSVAMYN